VSTEFWITTALAIIGVGIAVAVVVYPMSPGVQRSLRIVSVAMIVTGLLILLVPVIAGPQRENIGTLSVHRTWWQRALSRPTKLEPFASRTLEIGDSGAIFLFDGSGPVHQFFDAMSLKLEQSDTQLFVSAKIRDENELLVATIDQGKWQVAESNFQAWDFNYRDDALEVKNGAGRIVLQVRLLPDRVQVQGEDWGWKYGARLVSRGKGKGSNFVILTRANNPDEPSVTPLFLYPGKTNLGRYAVDDPPSSPESIMNAAVILYATLVFSALASLAVLRLCNPNGFSADDAST